MDKLQKKSYRTYDYISRYTSFPYYYDANDEKYIYGTTSNLNTNSPYTLYKVQKNDTYDSLALKFYNSPTFFWVICDFNKVRDPYQELKEGDMLKIPSITELKFM